MSEIKSFTAQHPYDIGSLAKAKATVMNISNSFVDYVVECHVTAFLSW